MPIEFDYIIAGGGSAGCVLASRLASNSNDSICLIEGRIFTPRQCHILVTHSSRGPSNRRKL